MDDFTLSWISSRNVRLSTNSTVLLGMTSSLNWASRQNSISVSVLNLANLGRMSCMTWTERRVRFCEYALKTQTIWSKKFFLVTFITVQVAGLNAIFLTSYISYITFNETISWLHRSWWWWWYIHSIEDSLSKVFQRQYSTVK